MIGGLLDYRKLAELNKPTDSAALREEVQRLAAEQHLSPIDISTALRLDLSQVREMLAATPSEAANACREAWNAR